MNFIIKNPAITNPFYKDKNHWSDSVLDVPELEKKFVTKNPLDIFL
jgi:hypothetical protein